MLGAMKVYQCYYFGARFDAYLHIEASNFMMILYADLSRSLLVQPNHFCAWAGSIHVNLKTRDFGVNL